MEADGVPSPVERVQVALPASQVGPISDLERSEIVEASPYYLRYRNREVDGEAMLAFINRMLTSRGFPELPAFDTSAEPWKEGDYAAFIPNVHYLHAAPRRNEGPLLRRAMAALAVGFGCLWWIGALVLPWG